MGFKIACPHCSRTLNVTEPAFGKTVPCPACNRPIDVAYPAQPPHQAVPAAPPAWAGAAQDGHVAAPPRPLPAATPPVPLAAAAPELAGGGEAGPAGPAALPGALQRLNLADMFLGNEKEQVFSLLPGEERIDELAIYHRYFLIVRSGITRLTLTTQRLLYTETRVFSPVYWVLLLLFPPLIFYYVIRIARNRNVALPLGSIDSVEKRYRPHWLWCVLSIGLAYLVAGLCAAAIAWLFGGQHQRGLLNESHATEIVVEWFVLGLLAPAVLILLLATRIVGLRVVTRNNGFLVPFNPGDFGVNEERFDAFLRAVHAQIERARAAR
jgi:hypothetical protein